MSNFLRRLGRAGQIIFAIGFTALVFFPIYWMFVTSVKPMSEITTGIPTLWPETFRWQNYADAWNSAPFGRFLINTIIQTVGILLLQLNVGILAAYAFAKGKFWKRDVFFLVILAALIVPDQVTFVPVYVMMSDLGWLNTFYALIIPKGASSYGIFLLRQAFRSINDDVIEAAKIDGAGRIRIIYGILVPMSRPTVITLGIFTLISSWNSYFWPLIMTNSESMRVLTLGIAMLKNSFPGTEVANWNLIMAGSVITMIPIVIFFFMAQKYIVEALSNATFR